MVDIFQLDAMCMFQDIGEMMVYIDPKIKRRLYCDMLSKDVTLG